MYSLSTNPGHEPCYVCVSVSVSVSWQDSTPTTGLLKVIPSFSVYLSSQSCHLLAFCLSFLFVCLCWHREAGQDLFTPSINVFLIQIITLIMLLSTSFPPFCSIRCIKVVCRWQNTHVPDILSNFSLISAAPCQKAGILCFDDCLDHFLFFSLPRFVCSNNVSVDGVTSASFLFLGVMFIQMVLKLKLQIQI